MLAWCCAALCSALPCCIVKCNARMQAPGRDDSGAGAQRQGVPKDDWKVCGQQQQVKSWLELWRWVVLLTDDVAAQHAQQDVLGG